MCSAVADDQNGLTAVMTNYQLNPKAFAPTTFVFFNGTKLTLTKDNIQDLQAFGRHSANSFLKSNHKRKTPVAFYGLPGFFY